MRRTKLILVALLAFVPAAARADVTARYGTGDKELLVEVDEGGDWRVDFAGKFAILRRNGTDYVVVPDKAVPKVFELQAMLDLVKGLVPTGEGAKAEEMQFGLQPGPAAIIAGQPGAAWKLVVTRGDAESMKRHIDVVVGADPALAPVGEVFRRTIAVAVEFFGRIFPEETGFPARLTELFAKGTPLRIAAVEEGAAKPEDLLIELKSFDTTEIDAKHFELPAPVTPSEEIFGSMDAMMKPGGGKIQDLP